MKIKEYFEKLNRKRGVLSFYGYNAFVIGQSHCEQLWILNWEISQEKERERGIIIQIISSLLVDERNDSRKKTKRQYRLKFCQHGKNDKL